MTIYYSKNGIELRVPAKADLRLLARRMRAQDRAELEACGLRADEETLARFVRQSAWCAVLAVNGDILAAGGFAPDTFFARRARVWMLSGEGVEKAPKTFFKFSRAVVAYGLTRYAELYNFTDERYTRALNYVRRMGGSFDGTGVWFGPRRFLLFRFRR